MVFSRLAHGFRLLVIGASLLSPRTHAETAAPAQQQRVRYSLRDLVPVVTHQYAAGTRAAQREYFHFQNEQGTHVLIYEEFLTEPEVPAFKFFSTLMAKPDGFCQIDLECRQPAFCTGACHNLYYETSNTPSDPALAGRNHCDVLSYKCDAKAGHP